MLPLVLAKAGVASAVPTTALAAAAGTAGVAALLLAVRAWRRRRA